MKPSVFKSRWTDAMLHDINQHILRTGKEAATGKKLAPDWLACLSPFGSLPSGRADYRGFVLTEAFKYVRLHSLDFTGLVCDSGGAFIDCQLEDCMLDQLFIDGRHLTKSMTLCSFVDASLRNSNLLGTFIGCNFTRANMTKAGGSETHFIRCNFNGANLRQAHLMTRCRFEHCSFEGTQFHNGSFSGSRFVGTWPTAEQFGNTILEHVTFENPDSSPTAPPTTPHNQN